MVTVLFVYINLHRISILFPFFFCRLYMHKKLNLYHWKCWRHIFKCNSVFFKIAMYVKNTWLEFLWHGVSARLLNSSKTLELFVSRQGNIKHLVQDLAFCTLENFFEIYLKIKILTKKSILWNIVASIYLVLYLQLLNHFFLISDRLQVAFLLKWNYNDKNYFSRNMEIF